MLTCPHCGEKSISVLQKVFVGPASTIGCRFCKKRSSVPMFSTLLFLPLYVLFASFPILSEWPWKYALPWYLAAILVTGYIQVKWIPLQKR